MRRLTTRGARRRLGDERGAVAVMVALMLVPLFGLGAIAVDAAALYADRAQLRTAADAAALAVAADCGRGACGNPVQTATTLVAANAGGPGTFGTPTVVVTGKTVSVTASAVQHWFAPVLGFDSTTLSVTSSAEWTAGAGSQTLRAPVAFSWCEYQAQLARGPALNGQDHHFDHQTGPSTTCTGPDGGTVSGGQVVLQPDASRGCLTAATVGGRLSRVSPATANQVATDCGGGPYKVGLLGTDIQIPIWDRTGVSGGTTWYRVYGFVTFRLANIELANFYYNNELNPMSPMLTGRFTSALDRSASAAASVSLVREK